MKSKFSIWFSSVTAILLVFSLLMTSYAASAAPGVPAGATVTSATFSIFVDRTSTVAVNLHRITAPWTELGATWNNFAASYDPAVVASFTPTAIGWQALDVTALVQAWVDGTVPNFGFLLEQGKAAYTSYYSSEWVTVEQRPKLEICYTAIATPNTCITLQRPGAEPGGVADTSIWQNLPNANFGTVDLLYTGLVEGFEKQTLLHYDFITHPAVEIVKYTNGYEASDPDGSDVPLIQPGDPVTWTYRVTNTGDVAVPRAQVAVTDNQTGVTPAFDSEISGNGDTIFDPLEVWLYRAEGIAANLVAPPAGMIVVNGVCTANGTQPPRTAYVNQGTVTIPGATATAPSSYCNPPTPGVEIIKYTNGQEASNPDGTDVPQIQPGQPVVWTYRVTNTGNVAVPRADVVVTDNQTGVIPAFDSEISGNGDTIFDPLEVWLYRAEGIAANLVAPPAGMIVVNGVCTANGTQPPRTAYVNQGTVTIPGDSDTAPSSYCNPPTPGVEIIKYTNGQEASNPNGTDVPNIKPGDPVTWTYRVTNTGNMAFPRADVVVTDNQAGVTPAFDSEISGNGDTIFDPLEVWLYRAEGIAANLKTPPAEMIVVNGVCTANGTQPPRTAYVNQGTVTIPGDTDTAQSSYCNPPVYTYFLPGVTSGNTEPFRNRWATAIGFEDLPLVTGNNDYDYNDWILDIIGNLRIVPGTQNISRIQFSFLPKARGAAYQHSFHIIIPANTFASNGTAVLNTYDVTSTLVGTQTFAFNTLVDNDIVIFPDTALVFPSPYGNTIEGSEPVPAQQTATLTIDFATPMPFDLTIYDFQSPHGEGLFFDPYIQVINTGEVIHSGDIRTLVVPVYNYMWPEEKARIDRAYPAVLFNLARPVTVADIIFPPGWYGSHTTCVYGDGIKCP